MSPFDFLNSINVTKENLIIDDITEKQYNAFMVNRGLSYFQDTILLANEMNILPQLDSRLQYDFLLNMVRKRKRFSKWLKAETTANLEAIKEFYGYNDQKALQIIDLLTPEQIDVIKNKINKGGRKSK